MVKTNVEDKSKSYLDLKVNPSSKYYYQIKLSKDVNNKLLNSDKVSLQEVVKQE